MKRLSVLVMTVFMALFLAACGNNMEKKVETEATPDSTTTQQAAPADNNAQQPAAEPAPAAPAGEPAPQPAQ